MVLMPPGEFLKVLEFRPPPFKGLEINAGSGTFWKIDVRVLEIS